MLNEFIDISVGMLLKVERGFWTSGKDRKLKEFAAKCYIPKGEIIEIRYPYEWHFRTQSNHYDHVSPDVLCKKCSFFGVVKDDIRFGNKHDLRQIIEQNLYHERSEFKLMLSNP